MASRRSSNMPPAMSQLPVSAGTATGSRASPAASSARTKAPAKRSAASRTLAVVGDAIRPARLGGDRGDDHVRHAAGVDELEVGEVGGHVEGDAVIADAALDADPERADLARRRAVRVDPATGVTVAAAGVDAVAGAGLGHGRLQGTHEGPQQDAPIGQADDGIGDQLAGSVIGDLAAALDPDELDASRRPARSPRHGRSPGRPGGRASGRLDARAAAACPGWRPAARASTRACWRAQASR